MKPSDRSHSYDERIGRMTIKNHHPRTLLMLLAAVALAVGLLALAGSKPAWAASRSFAQAENYPVGTNPSS